MKLSLTHEEERITAPIGTYIGTLEDVNWALGTGTVYINADIGSQPCRFKYGGQNWIHNMNSYSTEEITSHSAFAFCTNDKVIVVKNTQLIIDSDEYETIYFCVAVLRPDESAIDKRYVWPLYRIDHEATVLNATYSNESGNGAGFPFIDPSTSLTKVNPFVDQLGNTRPLGTFSPTANKTLVITKDGSTQYIPHAAHEFMTVAESFEFVPDALMQSKPNYKGRIVGLSFDNEILIDNIPVIKIGTVESYSYVSIKAYTHRFLHINEKQSKATVLFLTVDFDIRHYIAYGYPPLFDNITEVWRATPYPFLVSKIEVDLTSFCIYEAMKVGRANIPTANTLIDLSASWPWVDRINEPDSGIGRSYGEVIIGAGDIGEWAFCNNMTSDFKVASFGADASASIMLSISFNTPGAIDSPTIQSMREYVFKITTATDGSFAVDKSFKDAVPLIPTDSIAGWASLYRQHNYYTGTFCVALGQLNVAHYESSRSYRYDLGGYSATIIDRASGKLTCKAFATTSFSRNMLRTFTCTETNPPWVDDCLQVYAQNEYVAYYHIDPDGASTELCRMEAKMTGNIELDGSGVTNVSYTGLTETINNVDVYYKVISFTHFDTENFIYGFWEITIFDHANLGKIRRNIYYPGGAYWASTGTTVKWEHYIKTRTQKILTKTATYSIPYGYDDGVTAPYLTAAGKLEREALASLFRVRTTWPFDGIAGTMYSLELLNSYEYFAGDYTDEYTKVYIPYKTASWSLLNTFFYKTMYYHCYKNGVLYSDPGAIYKNFSLHPFGSGSTDKWLRWPQQRNIGTPALWQSDITPEAGCSLDALFYSKNTLTVTGMSFGLGQYKYTFTSTNGIGVVVESPGLADLYDCTKRADLILSND